jgi:hypothetical protein
VSGVFITGTIFLEEEIGFIALPGALGELKYPRKSYPLGDKLNILLKYSRHGFALFLIHGPSY